MQNVSPALHVVMLMQDRDCKDRGAKTEVQMQNVSPALQIGSLTRVNLRRAVGEDGRAFPLQSPHG